MKNFIKYLNANKVSNADIEASVEAYLAANPPATTGDDTAYNASSWNNSVAVPTKNAVRDKFVSVDAAISNKVDKETGKGLYPDDPTEDAE